MCFVLGFWGNISELELVFGFRGLSLGELCGKNMLSGGIVEVRVVI